jgi:uncharacterized membrane protein
MSAILSRQIFFSTISQAILIGAIHFYTLSQTKEYQEKNYHLRAFSNYIFIFVLLHYTSMVLGLNTQNITILFIAQIVVIASRLFSERMFIEIVSLENTEKLQNCTSECL